MSFEVRKEFTYTEAPFPRIADVIVEFPEFARKVAKICEHWNVLELNMLMLFVILLGGQDEGAFTIYYDVLKGRKFPRQQAFTKIAELRGLPDDVIKAVLKVTKTMEHVQDERDDVVHAVWARLPPLPGRLFAIKNKQEWFKNVYAVMTCSLAYERGASAFKPPDNLCTIRSFWEYTLDDFDEIYFKIEDLRVHVAGLHTLVASHVFPGQGQSPLMRAESIVHHLSGEPS